MKKYYNLQVIVLITIIYRLDVESKLPSELDLMYFLVRPEERVAALLVLLKNHIKENQKTIVFAATKHHVEYLNLVCFFHIFYIWNKTIEVIKFNNTFFLDFELLEY